MMNAVRAYKRGGREVLRYEDAPRQRLGANEVLVMISHPDAVKDVILGEARAVEPAGSGARR
jgi:hypothetical protein